MRVKSNLYPERIKGNENQRQVDKDHLNLRQRDRRGLQDRRRQATPGLSRFVFFGRRKTFRREGDRQKGGYVDRYSPGLFFMLVLILGLNILDALFTTAILNQDGWEVNPILAAVIDLYGGKFWIWKFGIVSTSLVLLCLHSKFRSIRTILVGLNILYLFVILHQILMLRNP
jgi:hypothetical protein